MTWFAKFAEDKAISRRVTSPPPPSRLIHKKNALGEEWLLITTCCWRTITTWQTTTGIGSTHWSCCLSVMFVPVWKSQRINNYSHRPHSRSMSFYFPPLSHLDASLKLQQVALVFMFSIAVVVIQAGPTRGQYYRTVWKNPWVFFFFFYACFFSPLTYVLQEESLPLLRWLMGISSDTHLCECRDKAEASDG